MVGLVYCTPHHTTRLTILLAQSSHYPHTVLTPSSHRPPSILHHSSHFISTILTHSSLFPQSSPLPSLPPPHPHSFVSLLSHSNFFVTSPDALTTGQTTKNTHTDSPPIISRPQWGGVPTGPSPPPPPPPIDHHRAHHPPGAPPPPALLLLPHCPALAPHITP